jgi:hypothetical protein
VLRVGKGQRNGILFVVRVGKGQRNGILCVLRVGKGQRNGILCMLRVGKGQRNGILCVVRVGKGQRIELCFKTAYRNCECTRVNVTSSKMNLYLKLFQNVQLRKRVYFDSLPISKRKYDDLQSTLNNKTQPHCHSRLYSGLKFEEEWFEVSGFSLVTFLTNI